MTEPTPYATARKWNGNVVVQVFYWSPTRSCYLLSTEGTAFHVYPWTNVRKKADRLGRRLLKKYNDKQKPVETWRIEG